MDKNRFVYRDGYNMRGKPTRRTCLQISYILRLNVLWVSYGWKLKTDLLRWGVFAKHQAHRTCESSLGAWLLFHIYLQAVQSSREQRRILNGHLLREKIRQHGCNRRMSSFHAPYLSFLNVNYLDSDFYLQAFLSAFCFLSLWTGGLFFPAD